MCPIHRLHYHAFLHRSKKREDTSTITEMSKFSSWYTDNNSVYPIWRRQWCEVLGLRRTDLCSDRQFWGIVWKRYRTWDYHIWAKPGRARATPASVFVWPGSTPLGNCHCLHCLIHLDERNTRRLTSHENAIRTEWVLLVYNDGVLGTDLPFCLILC